MNGDLKIYIERFFGYKWNRDLNQAIDEKIEEEEATFRKLQEVDNPEDIITKTDLVLLKINENDSVSSDSDDNDIIIVKNVKWSIGQGSNNKPPEKVQLHDNILDSPSVAEVK